MRRPTTKLIGSLAAIVFAAFGLTITARAQVDTNQPGVARVSMTQGDVSMQRGDSGDTSAVDLNTPLMSGDKVFTGSQARAEVQLDWADILRLDENAQMNIASLDENRIQVQFSQGLGNFSAVKGSQAQVEIDTPNVAIIPHGTGRYRIEVTPAGDTLVTVRDGEADISTPDGTTPLHRGEIITVRGAANDTRFQIAGAPSTDDFDRWNSDRDHVITNAESSHRTNSYYTGAQDLDAYGRWDNDPDYGYVWAPRVAVGWAPYRQGRWVWEPYWGWTWVSNEPWGWAPYHYGRWFVRGGSWVWWPGPVTPVYRPVYAPAYVSFFGFGSGVSFGFGFGSIGWIPAGPCDFVSPWWGRSRNTFNVVNVTNIYNVHNVNVIAPLRGGQRDSNVRNMMVNNQVRFGMSSVEAEHFGRGGGNVRTVSATELHDAKFVAGNVPVTPSRESLRASDRAPIAAPNANRNQQQFFTRHMPTEQHESFAAQSSQVQQAMERNPQFRGSQNNGGAPNANANAAGSGPQNSVNRGSENRPNGNQAGFTRQTPNQPADRIVNSEQSSTFRGGQAPAQNGAPQSPAGRNEPNAGGWNRFGQQQGGSSVNSQNQGNQGGSSINSQNQGNQNQRGPVMRAPRQTATVPETPQSRAERPQNPGANRGQSVTEQPRGNEPRGTPLNSQNNSPNNSQNNNQGPNRRFEMQGNGNGNNNSGAQQNSDRGPGWQRFSEQPRGNSEQPRSNFAGGGNSANSGPSPRVENRPPLELNRPIIQQRSYSTQERPAPSYGGGRASAPPPAPAPRSAPEPAAPRSEGPRLGSGNSGGGGGRVSSSQSRGNGGQHGNGRSR